MQICSRMFFYQECQIQDFPVRDKRLRLFVKPRRRKEKSTDKTVSKNWDLVAQGTRHSKEFAAFFKGCLEKYPRFSHNDGWHNELFLMLINKVGRIALMYIKANWHVFV